MVEVEYGGVKLTGSKLFMIIPLVSMLGGGLWEQDLNFTKTTWT